MRLLQGSSISIPKSRNTSSTLCSILYLEVFCSETDEDIAKYLVLHGNEQLFASKYKLYLPTEEELREEIQAQKAIFLLQQKE